MVRHNSNSRQGKAKAAALAAQFPSTRVRLHTSMSLYLLGQEQRECVRRTCVARHHDHGLAHHLRAEVDARQVVRASRALRARVELWRHVLDAAFKRSCLARVHALVAAVARLVRLRRRTVWQILNATHRQMQTRIRNRSRCATLQPSSERSRNRSPRLDLWVVGYIT